MNEMKMFLFICLSYLFADDVMHPQAPHIPEIQALTSDERVLLMWDGRAEDSIDPYTQYADFEGYRIYRSTDGGATWGDLSDRVFDYSGNFVGWKPYAQFDLIEDSDSTHCVYSNGYMGESGENCYSLGLQPDKVGSGLIWESSGSLKSKVILKDKDPDIGICTGFSSVDILLISQAECLGLGECSGASESDFPNGEVITESQCHDIEGNYCSDSNFTTKNTCLEDGVCSDETLLSKNHCLCGIDGVWDGTTCTDGILTENSWTNANTWDVDWENVSEWDEEDTVFLPQYIRGSCPVGQTHVEHDADESHLSQDCYNGGYLSEFDPMASWVSLGENDSLKRTFIDTEVLDGVEYTYAVTAYDTGLKTFKVDYLNVDENASGNNDYCNGNDSYCNGTNFNCVDGEGDEVDGSYCEGGFEGADESSCGGFGGGTWVVVPYTDENECLCGVGGSLNSDAESCDVGSLTGYTWDEEIFNKEEDCLENNYQWVVLEYDNEDECFCGIDGLWDSSAESCLSGSLTSHSWTIAHFLPDTTWSSWNPGHFLGKDYSVIEPLWGYPSFESPRVFESFTDYNSNGICDGEPFIDMDDSDFNGNGLCDMPGDWSSRCPDDLDDCLNVITAIPGYKASNITFPDEENPDAFMVPDEGNRGNGKRLYNIVNEYELRENLGNSILRFEINAGLNSAAFGDESGSFATLDPSLFIYVSQDTVNKTIPKKDGVHYLISEYVQHEDSLIGLPGARYSDDQTEIILPEYKLEDFRLTYIDDPLFKAHFTDWFDGIQFRFDNGPNKNTDALQLVELKNMDFYTDGGHVNDDLSEILSIKMKYINTADMARRPMYKYRVEFSDDLIGYGKAGTGSNCNDFPNYPSEYHTFLPFTIENETNGLPVQMRHNDDGIQSAGLAYDEFSGGNCTEANGEACSGADRICVEGTCQDRIGNDDCSWQRNESIQLNDFVFSNELITENICESASTLSICESSNTQSPYFNKCLWNSNVNKCIDADKLFEIKIDFSYIPYILKHVPNYFQIFDGIEWKETKSYGKDDIVLYDGMLFKAESSMPDGTTPTDWYDDDSSADMDGYGNDNPWIMLYPWDDGDYVIIEPYGWYQDGDGWVADLSIIGREDGSSKDDLDNMSVVPNPYIVNSNYFNESPGNNLLRFTRLPNKCTISIYTVSGEFVTTINHDDPFDGNAFWNLKNGRGEVIAPGLYIYVVETPDGEKKVDKFAVVR